jgi:serine/threonine protein kinase
MSPCLLWDYYSHEPGSRNGGNWHGSVPITYILCCRDVKPSNFLYDRVGRRYALVDFGLAQYQKDLCAAAAAGQQQATGRGSKRKAEEDHESETASYSKKGESLRQCYGAGSVGIVSFRTSWIRNYLYGSGSGYVIQRHGSVPKRHGSGTHLKK